MTHQVDYSFVLGKRYPYTKLTPLRYSHSSNGSRLYLCKCECGNIKAIRRSHLKDGSTKTCGCLQKERRKNFHKVATKESCRKGGINCQKMKVKIREAVILEDERQESLGKVKIHQFEHKADKGSPYMWVTDDELNEIFHGFLEVDWKNKKLNKVLETNEHSIYAT